ncbi:MAG: class 1 fructose-bisphosphatase [Candidatus Tectomicrobia bacterium]|nr:class 1 fructose-bisphosphatase [Candidatus Tectomicrobia bacterium]
MSSKGITLSHHILEQVRKHPGMDEDLVPLLTQIGFVGKILAREIRRAALIGLLGLTGEKNVQGEATKKLDVFGHETTVEALGETGVVAAVISEEADELVQLAQGKNARYVVCIDPLDGSSNTDINGPVGTIFGIQRRENTSQPLTPTDYLLPGSKQVASGYIMYGPSTALVYTAGHGVFGFTLDHDIGEFLLSHDDIHMPQRGHYYAGNLGHYYEWDTNIQKFIEYLTQHDTATHRPYSLRYVGALVADLHRTLLEGGIYIYPPDGEKKEGKLRLLYEGAPLGFVVEQAGGKASTGIERILDIQPYHIHQRVPLIIGTSEEVTLYEKFLKDGRA